MAHNPLQNRTILITRAKEQSSNFAEQVVKLGGTPIVIPLIAFRPAPLSIAEKQLLMNTQKFKWIIFTSVNGVEYFFQLYEKLNDEQPVILGRFAVVGEKTKRALAKKGYTASLIPEEYVAEGLVKAFQDYDIQEENILYIRGNLSRDVIPFHLGEQGANVTKLTVYETICPVKRQELIEVFKKHVVDAITFTSPSTIKHFVHLLKGTDWNSWIQNTAVCCIGPITKRTAIEYGMVPKIVPNTYTMEHLLEELEAFFRK
jgi:uroporphyrinogen-III synthase